ncbi:Secreted RxLR effector peptide protein [Phytophthora palmivora]|uniref:RxLR effector protein n=1 Tax=Phytophthora palmivora TaxID=4796 RepID=A0A2P4WXS6_9STRA|nr:Secreted RxLR effector peptide protein [Phytophthora palmivora]
MRTCFVLLLAAVALLTTINAVSGSTIKLRASENPTQVEITNGRVLRGGVRTENTIDTDGEERNALTNAITKLSSNTNARFKNARLVAKLKRNSHYIYSEKITQELMKRKLTPDDVYTALTLSVRKNQWKSNGGHTSAYKLWQNYFFSFKDANPRWRGQFNP